MVLTNIDYSHAFSPGNEIDYSHALSPRNEIVDIDYSYTFSPENETVDLRCMATLFNSSIQSPFIEPESVSSFTQDKNSTIAGNETVDLYSATTFFNSIMQSLENDTCDLALVDHESQGFCSENEIENKTK
ncbi:hypothetical protein F8M41_012016 [Gigaspora margarita]|uniref:Uncharacterized protein n=1 Tax=Gigaspora margarita TaxID=4874 RepID=A0A8H4A1C1_GIGMA|nr:hypothetical protein F8M41_012016 [Gigaspora margarita]